MNTISQCKPTIVTLPAGMDELVRGTDHIVVAKLEPMVREADVTLDFGPVRRIDAAGIAALISLYHCAHENGHNFSVCNVAHRIDEILRLVGLEAILVAHDPCPAAAPDSCLEQSAA